MKLIIGILLSIGVVSAQSNVISLVAPPPPAIPTNQISTQVIGTKGTQTYYYWVVVDYPIGSSVITGPILTKNVPDTLSASNYVQISFPNMSSATGYDVLRTTTPVLPSGTSNIAVSTNSLTNPVTDQSNTLSSYTQANASNAQLNLILDNQNYTSPMFTTQNLKTGVTTFGGLVSYPTSGFTQSSSPSSLISNGYAYSFSPPSFNPLSFNTYSSFWLNNGFPVTSMIGAAGNGVANYNDIFRVSGNNTAGRTNIMSVYGGATGGGTGMVPFYAQGSTLSNGVTYTYGGNVHASGCEGFKCNGTNYPDHNPTNLIGWEVDTEIRNASTQGIGIYNVCVNCNPFTATSAAFVADANKSLGIGDAAFKPWGTGYQTTNGGAVHGSIFNPTSASVASDSQDSQWCAFIDAGVTKACSSVYTTQNQVTQILSPGSKVYMLNSAGNALSTLHSQLLANAYTAVGPTALTNTTMEEFVSNTGAAGTVNLTLPNTAVAGLRVYFYVAANQTLNISAGLNTIQIGAQTGTTLSSNIPGSNVTLIGTSPTNWVVSNSIGFWTLDSATIINTQQDKSWVTSMGGSTVASGTTTYFAIGPAAAGTEGTRLWVSPYAGTITGVGVYMTTAILGTVNSVVFTLRKNLANTTNTFSIPFGSAAGGFSDTTHTVSMAAGDRFSLQVFNNTDVVSGSFAGFWVSYR